MNPISTMMMFLIPTSTYIILKISGSITQKEWLWWIIIPIMFTIWFFINFKLKSKTTDKC